MTQRRHFAVMRDRALFRDVVVSDMVGCVPRLEGEHMRRREFVHLAGGAAVAWPFGALAQKPDRTWRIGVLMSLGENDSEGNAQLSGFTQGLADLGRPEGPNLRMDVRWGGGDINKIR